MSALGLSGREIRNYFSADPVLLDNFIFKLHHQLNFFLVLLGMLFASSMNYLKGDSIICKGHEADDYVAQYCWLHGSGHLSGKLAAANSKEKCIAEQNETEEDDSRHTHYYLWLPFVLAICLILIKAPRLLWSKVLERGIIQGVVEIANEETEETGEKGEMVKRTKLSERFVKLQGGSTVYGVSYFLCETLNIVSVIACYQIVDTLLGGQFWHYGSQFHYYEEEAAGAVNPLCNVFPTEVSCGLMKGLGATGNPTRINILCLLSNNLFHQYYFLLLWWWWLTLLSLSALGFLYRLAQLLSPAVSRFLLSLKLAPCGQAKYGERLRNLNQWDYFLLGRICQNLKGSQIDAFLGELVYIYQEKKELDRLENHVYIEDAEE